jgi:N6-L-threonylcarbamoyladenine synthase
MLILGIESSCDETGIAVYDTALGVLAQALHSQVDMHRAYGGVVPELASRDHIRRTLPLIEQALADAGRVRAQIDAIAVTAGPGLAGALLVGSCVAHAIGYALQRPVIDVHHLEGHLLSVQIGADPPAMPFVALLVSGGHTLLLHVTRAGQYQTLGETLDDAAGEAFDKVAQLLGLGYPGGPAVSHLAGHGTGGAILLPRPMLRSGDLDFSFSGLKTAVATTVRRLGTLSEQQRADVARGFVDAVVDVLAEKSRRALERTGAATLVVAGGVSANRQLRERLAHECASRGITLRFPPPALCTDNGAMIAVAGAAALLRDPANRMRLAFDVRPRWSLADAGL